jgi:hypothetical protein
MGLVPQDCGIVAPFKKIAEQVSGSSDLDFCVFFDAPFLFCALADPPDLELDSFACSRRALRPECR